ncbi:MAG TPA: transposase [Candidatus Micrarchaeaceae archaeon]|nr:transposase [Candidatus Micrarchaeaceae archaeon]
MDGQFLDMIDTCFLLPQADFLEQLDEAIRSLRGESLLPCRVLLAGLVYIGLEAGPNTLTRVARFYQSASEGQLRRVFGMPVGATHQHLPAPEPPDRWQLYRVYDALATGLGRVHAQREERGLRGKRLAAAQRRWQRQEESVRELLGAFSQDEARFRLTAQLLVGTAPPQPDGAPYTVDTTDIDADCRPVSGAKIRRGEFAADPDARWRVKKTGALDPDSPHAKAAQASAKVKKVFGYECVTIGGTDDNVSYVYAAHCVSANEHDVPVALRLLDRMAEDGYQVGELVSDRGYSGGVNWLDGQRDRGVLPTYDLKHLQGARDPDFLGCLVLQGWPYLPQLPLRLRYLARPGLQAPVEKIKKFRADIAERQKYALLPHGAPTPTGTRVLSPLARKSKRQEGRLGCPKVPGSMRSRDLTLIPCSGDHGLDEGCCIKTATFKAAFAPQSFQTPIWGTPEWEAKYAKRTNVERGYSTVKNPDVIGLNKGLFHMRGLPNFSLLVTCMWIAHNLYLRMKAQADRLKVTRVGERARRKHRRRNQVPFVVAPDQAGSVPAIEVARAP